MLTKVRALFVAKWHGAEMAAALFEGEDRWRALMSIGAERLSDYQTRFPTREGAQSGAYLGIRIYLDMTKQIRLPSIDSLQWKPEGNPDHWVETFYSKPLQNIE
jgi:hypothetical protein